MSEGAQGAKGMQGAQDEVVVSMTPGTWGAVRPLDPARNDEAAAILAAATFESTAEAGFALLAATRSDDESAVYGLTVHDRLVAIYVLKRISMALEVTALAVAEGDRRQGHGRACLTDALRRAGRRPLVAETDEEGLPFYKAVGFKIIGRRTPPSGTPRFRLGWHAPIPHAITTLQSGSTTPRSAPSSG